MKRPPSREVPTLPPEPTGPPKLSMGWRIALGVWGAGFAGLILYELLGLLWKVLGW